MGNIVLTRIDDRLIHGQVMTSWLNYTGANKIMVIDNPTAADPFLKTVLKNAVPGNVKLGLFDEAKAADRLKNGFKPEDKVIILVKYPKTILNLIEMGCTFETLNVGGMGASEGRNKLYKNISATEDEKGYLKKIIEAGTKVEIQIIAENEKIDMAQFL